MGRRTIANDYLTPLKSTDGTAPPMAGDAAIAGNRGTFTLAPGTYYIPLGGQDAKLLSFMSQWDATAVITTITIEETDAPPDLVSDWAASAGNWFSVDTTRLTSSFNGAGTTTNASDVIAHTVAGAGGSIQNLQDSGARRVRAAVVVATQGECRFFSWGQE